MGLICGKPSAVEDSRESPPKRSSLTSSKRLSDIKIPRLNSSKREVVRSKDRLDGSGGGASVKVMLIDKAINGSVRLYDDQNKSKVIENAGVTVVDHLGSRRIPRVAVAEQVAAGWPGWLSAAAAEAINGWIPRRADTFQKLNKIGQGTYSSVYKARDVLNDKFVALKKVRFDNLDPESVKFMAREILFLRRLNHPNVIKLEGLITSRTSSSLYLVFEYMEHDLTGLASRPGINFSEPQLKCYMQQLLSGLNHCHSHGVLHRDIKGSNLLIDNNGILKIADFGLASFYDPHHSVPLTSRVVTLWYRPPELLLGASKYGVAVDLWSTGCILGELYSGKPILPGKTEVEQLHKIFKLCGSPSDDYWRKLHLRHSTVIKPPQPYRRCVAETFKDLPAAALQLMESLLSVDPSDRGTAAIALNSEYFTSKPLACEPSSMPKYPPCKEIDAKLREDEARRQGAIRGRAQKVDLASRGQPSSAANANTESNTSAQIRQGYSNPNIRSEMFNPHREEATSSFIIDPTKQLRTSKDTKKDFSEHHNKRTSVSGPLIHAPAWAKSGKELGGSNKTNLSKLSGLVLARTTAPSEDQKEKPGSSGPETTRPVGRFQGSFDGEDFTKKQDQMRRTQRIPSSHQIEDEKANVNGHGPKGNKIYVSGPLLVSSNNVDQMLKEHDRRIQEYARRARLDKSRPGKQGMGNSSSSSRH
ncbi:probable serine/threonine-protein kinase At1g54610 [Argentina anserina]|uniref:probable serine/threonine-protein kinase At1g54610 n=1 Tax=Argentina anserina TaxID=57926 RepID=UPI002176389B|nr:probable serine/threonine-protein kinase At1g54610 [Potentilla anserina]